MVNSLTAINVKSLDSLSLYKMIKKIQNEELSLSALEETKNDKEAAEDVVEAPTEKLDDETITSLKQAIDTDRLIEVYLLGKSKRYIRIAAAHLLKSLYDSGCLSFEDIIKTCLDKFKSLGSAGVNSSEFLSIFGYLCDKELQKDTLSDAIISKIIKFISSQISACNQ